MRSDYGAVDGGGVVGGATADSSAGVGGSAYLPASGRLSGTTAGWFAALVGWTLITCFYRLDAPVGFEPVDCWVAQTAREMQENLSLQRFIIPQFSGETRLQKSPGAYWLVLLVSSLRGAAVDEVATRIPNACFAVLQVITIFWLARRMAGDRVAIFAGFAASASVFTLYWSRSGSSDLGLAALMTLSLACLWVATAAEPPGRRRNALWLLGYFAAGLAMLYKMPMPLACIGLPALLYVAIRREWRIFGSRWHLVGLLLFLLPWLPWVLLTLAWEPTALQKWRAEYLDRFTGDLPNIEDTGEWYLYLLAPLVYCVPFTLSLPQSFRRAVSVIRGRHPDLTRAGVLFLLLWFGTHLVFFTVATGKEMRYFLPALPPLLILLGIELSAFFDPLRPVNERRDRLALRAVWVLVPVGFGAGVLGLWKWFRAIGSLEGFRFAEVLGPYLVLAAILTLGFGFAAWLYARRRENAAFGALVGTMYVAWLYAWPNLAPILRSERPFIEVAGQISDIPAEFRPALKAVGLPESRVVWYSDVRYPRVIDQLELIRMQGGRRDRDTEKTLIAERMVELLDRPELVLFVSRRPEYVEFIELVPPELAKRGREMPMTYLWVQNRQGRQREHVIVFGNQPPPWPEPPLNPPSERLTNAVAARPAELRGATPTAVPAPATSPAP